MAFRKVSVLKTLFQSRINESGVWTRSLLFISRWISCVQGLRKRRKKSSLTGTTDGSKIMYKRELGILYLEKKCWTLKYYNVTNVLMWFTNNNIVSLTVEQACLIGAVLSAILALAMLFQLDAGKPVWSAVPPSIALWWSPLPPSNTENSVFSWQTVIKGR